MYSTKIAGFLSFLGACQFLIIMLICEALYPGYSISENMISDLGIGGTAGLFNSSIMLLGAMMILSALSFHSFHGNRLFSIMMILTGAGAIGVGIFPEDIRPYHEICAGITFLSGGLSEMLSVFLIRFPMSMAAALLGGLTLGCLALFALGSNLGLGPGGMERMIVYPVILWGGRLWRVPDGVRTKVSLFISFCQTTNPLSMEHCKWNIIDGELSMGHDRLKRV